MIEKTIVDDHLRNINTITNQLANIGIVVPNEELLDRVFTSVPLNWSIFKQMASKKENPYSFSELESLMIHKACIGAQFNN